MSFCKVFCDFQCIIRRSIINQKYFPPFWSQILIDCVRNLLIDVSLSFSLPSCAICFSWDWYIAVVLFQKVHRLFQHSSQPLLFIICRYNQSHKNFCTIHKLVWIEMLILLFGLCCFSLCCINPRW